MTSVWRSHCAYCIDVITCHLHYMFVRCGCFPIQSLRYPKLAIAITDVYNVWSSATVLGATVSRDTQQRIRTRKGKKTRPLSTVTAYALRPTGCRGRKFRKFRSCGALLDVPGMHTLCLVGERSLGKLIMNPNLPICLHLHFFLSGPCGHHFNHCFPSPRAS